jgi:hypothetical protein
MKNARNGIQPCGRFFAWPTALAAFSCNLRGN